MGNYSLAVRVLPEAQRTITAATLAGSPGVYLGVGTSIEHPARIFFIQNLTDALLQFSFDGVTDHFPLPSNGFLLVDVSSNSSVSQAFMLSQGQRLYAKTSGVPASGSVYFTVFYGANV